MSSCTEKKLECCFVETLLCLTCDRRKTYTRAATYILKIIVRRISIKTSVLGPIFRNVVGNFQNRLRTNPITGVSEEIFEIYG